MTRYQMRKHMIDRLLSKASDNNVEGLKDDLIYYPDDTVLRLYKNWICVKLKPPKAEALAAK